MPLSSNPSVQVTFNSLDRMSCTLFLQKTPGSNFQKINNTFDNEDTNVFSLTIDPTKPPINETSFNDLMGCTLGWVVQCFDLDNNASMTFSFEINVIDSGANIMSTTFTQASNNVTISNSGNTAVFDGIFRFE